MACKLCETRRARRFCPGVGGEICSVCCGTERENSVACPLECEYLQKARPREKPPEIKPEELPNRDIQVSDQFLNDNSPLIGFLMPALVEAGLDTPGTVDFDVREALDSLVRTYRTRESGLYYESRPANLVAARIHDHVQRGLEEFRRAAAERAGLTTLRDADILGVLVFLQRVEFGANNGRKRGRAFLDFLRTQAAPETAARGQSSVVLP